MSVKYCLAAGLVATFGFVPAAGAQEYTGDPVSLQFQNADLRSVLRTFADISGLNLVLDPAVDGIVDVALTDVPWDQAFEVILRSNQLDYEAAGNIVRIAPLATLTAEAEQRRRLAEEEVLAGDLVVRTRALDYSQAAELAPIVTQAALSPRGQMQIDARTNTLILTDLAHRLDTAEKLIATLDRPQPQVEIEARIVQASEDYLRELGVRWGVTGHTATGSTARVAAGGRLAGTQGLGAEGADPTADVAENAGRAVDLRAQSAAAAVGLALGAVDGSWNLDLALSAAEEEGEVQILSTPRVTTQNNVQATIRQGDQIPIQTVANNTVTVTFRDAALRLAVTPRIAARESVILQIEIDNDYADFARQVNGVPPIVTQSAHTTVQVGNGETTVIAGIYERTSARADRRVPGLSRIPLVGRLFRNEADRRRSDQLLIFLTPRIVLPHAG
ncbi:MAG: type IV pilus secretin PilQ [Acidobacteria bacterium]|nr:type IV pilus secretin PilQ [Acidobacteriota bacterium]MYJ04935.1 type IV pilus secretin PilQ [Acidobacteriota bacterium]